MPGTVDYFVSDVHLAPDRPDVSDRFLRFLDAAGKDAERLFLLGDIWDLWVGPKQTRLPYAMPVLQRLREMKKGGVEVVFLPGNRDFNFDPQLNGDPVKKEHPEDLSIESAGLKVYLTHGDLLCTADHSYKRARAMLRSGPVRAIFNHMPLPISIFLSEGYRRLSGRAVARKPRRQKSVDFARVRSHLLRGHDAVICGHVHRAARYRVDLPGGRHGEFVTLGDWGRRGVYAVSRGDRLALRSFP